MNSSNKIPKYTGLLPVIGRWLLTGLVIASSSLSGRAQIASFNFSAASVSVSGWKNVAGNASDSVITATSNGITVSSVATANWAPYSGSSALNGYGYYPGTYFPANVMSNTWLQYNGSARTLANYNALMPQLELTGLNPDSTYILRMSGSNTSAYVSNPTVYTVAGMTVYSSQSLNAHQNATQGVTFEGITPDATGMIRIYVNTTSSTDVALICGLEVFSGTAPVGTPAVTISNPVNGAVLSEGANVLIKATAVEAGATISKVQFYADTTKIGEVDTVPYMFTWVDPDPGTYQLTVIATDNTGTIGETAIGVGISSLNYFWSTTGNAGNKGDSNFVGNVDSVRLGFRTKDIERLTISPTGNVGIGTIAPTAKLNTTGSVRLSGLALDSAAADPRILVSDTNGNLSYRSAAGILGPSVGDGLGVSATGSLTLGDTIPGSTPQSFTSNRYQYLNGYMYSIGGSVNDPVARPDFRIYNNGDLTAGTTMDLSVNTDWLGAMRYYSKRGILELGVSDRLDTTQSNIVYGTWPESGLLSNSDDSNQLHGKLLNSIYLGDDDVMDSGTYVKNSLVGMDGIHLNHSTGHVDETMTGTCCLPISAPVSNSILTGVSDDITMPVSLTNYSGYLNITADTVSGSLAAGESSQLGGRNQLEAGNQLINFTPYGTALGNINTDFVSLPSTGTQGTNVAGIAGYPLLAIGNSSTMDASVRSNALTVLYNGRTQINTTGFSNALAQADVTPKAALEVVSNNTGVLFPKLTTAQRNAILTADLQNGLLLYNTDSSLLQFYNGGVWSDVGAAASVPGWDSSGNTGTNPTNNFVGTTDNESLAFRTNDVPHLTILAAGAIGIGTSVLPQPDAQLAVNGAFYATKIEVIQTGWPDYVFNKGYSLPGLAHLEQYIRLHRHLPGVIPAGEVAKQGIDLGENQSTLLRKIEELTLYLIEADQQSDLRQKEIVQLEKQNKSLDDHQREIDQLMEKLKKMTTAAGATKP